MHGDRLTLPHLPYEKLVWKKTLFSFIIKDVGIDFVFYFAPRSKHQRSSDASVAADIFSQSVEMTAFFCRTSLRLNKKADVVSSILLATNPLKINNDLVQVADIVCVVC